VSVELTFGDTSKQTMVVEVDTEPYVDPNGIYDRPNILKAREPSSSLGYDYIALKNMHGGPVIIDTDGAVRWVGPDVGDSTSTAFLGNGFEIGSQDSTVLAMVELDGTVGQVTLVAPGYLNFHHNIDAGKTSLLADVDHLADGVKHLESKVAEVTAVGVVLGEWDLANDGQSLLINYAVADNRTHARVVGLDASHNTVFDFEYSTTSCDTSWNAILLPLQRMEFR
jgi:hypothetical protein